MPNQKAKGKSECGIATIILQKSHPYLWYPYTSLATSNEREVVQDELALLVVNPQVWYQENCSNKKNPRNSTPYTSFRSSVRENEALVSRM